MSDRKLSIEDIKSFAALFFDFHRPWVVVVGILVFLSLFTVKYTSADDFAVSLQVSTTSLALVSLVWLPALLKIIALIGGGLKFGGGEASSKGLLGLLPEIISVFESAEPGLDDERRATVEGVRKKAERELAEFSTKDSSEARKELESLAEEYDSVRRTMKSSYERTKAMGVIVAQMRSLVQPIPYTAGEIKDLFAKGTGGSRLLALTMLRENYAKECFELVLEGIRQSLSAYEQYRALSIASHVLPTLDADERASLKQVLKEQMSGGKTAYLTEEDTDRRAFADRILAKLP